MQAMKDQQLKEVQDSLAPFGFHEEDPSGRLMLVFRHSLALVSELLIAMRGQWV